MGTAAAGLRNERATAMRSLGCSIEARGTETALMGRILLGIVIGIAIVLFLLVQCAQAIF